MLILFHQLGFGSLKRFLCAQAREQVIEILVKAIQEVP
jgi:hypothetical protein